MVLGAQLASVRGVRAGVIASPQGPRLGAVDGGTGPVDLVGLLKFFQEDVMEPLPNAGLLPGLEVVLAGLAAAPAQLGGQVLPVDPGPQDEDDAGEDLAVVQGLSPGEARPARRRGWQQRFDALPQGI